ncbi:hypothetical protein KUTeg_001991 [Tegillarca granosa]|uniref:5'-nucleotidase n=1 Tax=Tegillarca granosa TaxID=220873 RepID=A0ABQ9FSZ9_TEGGR|nr:hypothetical protein KUTeg_001991 [Tegillarca granosa]
MDSISELSQPHVYIKDVEHVNKVIRQIINDGPDKLQITADFDRTLTKYTNKGKICATCHNVLEEGGVLPETYKRKALELRDTYFSLETNPHMTIEEKIPLMIEWWTKAHDLLQECGLQKGDIRTMVQKSSAMLRDGCSWLFDELNRFEIPVLIFSAGIGDVIEEVLREQSTMHENMKVVSNYIDFDDSRVSMLKYLTKKNSLDEAFEMADEFVEKEGESNKPKSPMRGQYKFYTPEMRYNIGKHAAEYGNKSATQKFSTPEKKLSWDQTGIHTVPVSQWTMEIEGSKRVEITGIDDKRQITGTFAGTLVGDFLPMQLIYGGKTDMCHPKFSFPSSFNITHSENHWANAETMAEYINKIIVPYIDSVKDEKDFSIRQKSLVIFDCFRGQITDEFLSLLNKESILYATIPPNCTDKLQPMDLSVNKCAKDFLKEQFQQYYAKEVTKQQEKGISVEEIKIDLSLTNLKPLGARWLLKLYHFLKSNPDTIYNGFHKASIAEAGKMIGFKGEMIHVYNKNEGAVHDSDYFKNLEHRHNVILMGDSLGDLHMADGAVNVQNKLKIGFLNVKVEESLELYKNKYDIVIAQDETVDVVNALMRRILENKD